MAVVLSMVASCIPSCLLLMVLVVTAVSGASVSEFYPVCFNLCDYHDCLQESWNTGFQYPTYSMAPLTMVQVVCLLKQTDWIALIFT